MLSHFSHVQLCATLWTAAHQASLSMGFSRQEYWCGELTLQGPIPGELTCLIQLFKNVSTFWLYRVLVVTHRLQSTDLVASLHLGSGPGIKLCPLHPEVDT